MRTFDFSVPPPLSLAEEGVTILEWPTGEKQVEIGLEQGELFVQGKRIVPYLPARQVAYSESVDLQEAVSLLQGLPLVHPMLAQIFHDHPDLIPVSLRQFIGGDSWNNGGIIFPRALLQTWTKKTAHLSLFSIEGSPHFSYPILDRLPYRKSYLIEIG